MQCYARQALQLPCKRYNCPASHLKLVSVSDNLPWYLDLLEGAEPSAPPTYTCTPHDLAIQIRVCIVEQKSSLRIVTRRPKHQFWPSGYSLQEKAVNPNKVQQHLSSWQGYL